MCDVRQLFERQARWQKSRQALSWPEKIRMAERIRDSIQMLRVTCGEQVESPTESNDSCTQPAPPSPRG